MAGKSSHTAERIMKACEQVICEADHFEEATLRKITARAKTTASAVSYYFGGQEQLLVMVAERVYQRLNAERLSLLNRALARSAPRPPSLAEIIEAMVAPSVRWALDPSSGHRVLVHLTQSAKTSQNPEIYRGIVLDVEHHRQFIPHFRSHAPWLSDAEIGWRIACALAIRSQVLSARARTRALTGPAFALDSVDAIVAHIVAVVAPMFTHPPEPSPHRNS